MNFDFTKCIGMGFPGGSALKSPPANAGAMSSIPGLGRSLEEVATHSVFLENSFGTEAWQAAVMVSQGVGYNSALNNNKIKELLYMVL